MPKSCDDAGQQRGRVTAAGREYGGMRAMYAREARHMRVKMLKGVSMRDEAAHMRRI